MRFMGRVPKCGTRRSGQSSIMGRKRPFPRPAADPYLCSMEHDEARDRMRKALDQVHQWPSVYMFKFILEPEQDKLDALMALFPPEAEVLRKYSKGGKYVSLTVREVMMNADEVVQRYDRTSKIDGVIAL